MESTSMLFRRLISASLPAHTRGIYFRQRAYLSSLPWILPRTIWKRTVTTQNGKSSFDRPKSFLVVKARTFASAELQTSSLEEAVVHLSDSCVRRLKKLQSEEPDYEMFLRVAVEGGGCSGFQYTFTLDHKMNDDDKLFEKEGAKLVVDETSLDYLKGSTVDFAEELIRSAFRVVSNPKAEQGCSCGSSFSVKI